MQPRENLQILPAVLIFSICEIGTVRQTLLRCLADLDPLLHGRTLAQFREHVAC